MEWQDDMSKAPRDGTIILLSDGRWVHAGAWNPAIKGDGWPWAFLDDMERHQPHGCCDHEDGERVQLNGWRVDGPTHWMPLPPSPGGA
jgi:hypothetical protein